MAKMMKALVFLGMFLGAAATAEQEAKCALNGAQSVSELSDVVVFLWAATERCGPHGNALSPKCAVDIASAMKAVNDMIMVIVKAAAGCGSVNVENYNCGMAVGSLTSAGLKLAAGSAGIFQDCQHSHPTSATPKIETRVTTVGKCFANVKGAVADLFKATLKLSKVTSDCEAGSDECANNALNIISFFADMGSALAGAVDECTASQGAAHNEDAACAKSVLAGVSGLHGVANAGMKVSQQCTVNEDRLYQLNGPVGSRVSSFTPTLIMGAFLPIFAVLGFFAGSKFAKGRA